MKLMSLFKPHIPQSIPNHGLSYSLTAVRTSRSMRVFAFLLLFLLVSLIIVLVGIPWVQTVNGDGQVTALIPNQRPQTVQAQIKGRLEKWYVTEGQFVQAGDTIAILEDIDSKFLDFNLIENQSKQLEALKERKNQIEMQVQVFRQQVEAERNAREAGVMASKQKLQQSIQKRIAAEATVKQAELDYDIAKTRFEDRKQLFEKGLRSQRDFERDRMDLQRSEVSLTKAQTDAEGARRNEQEERSNVINKESEGSSKIFKVMSDETKAMETIASLENSIAKGTSELNTALARRNAAIVRSPVNGKVVRLLTLGSGETLKQGQEIAIIVPDANSLAVELMISGNDAPLLSVGRKVRLQFDGFPGFQISGWPSVSVGTFGGIISVIDAVDDEKSSGKFRVVVRPDPNDEQWPESKFLRPGTRSLGWMQLNTVTLGFELWRQFNGFPPTVDKPKDGKKSKKDDDSEE
ncbi:MAG: HlyD family efflux transporter periplasmic adaptor subunit [Candidatus Kapabacteria bacterium]|nr:HlyD family efflux transporter periplasmic adaptor subunit [Candidatus Kapabacteria bacterium]